MRYKVAVRFVIDGDLRFISHHDTMRLFERALVRSRLPIRFSEGFNPRPKLSLPLPRAVGTATEADLLVFELGEPVEPAMILARLSGQMPVGVTLAEAWVWEGKRVPRAEQAEYAVPIPPDQVDVVAEGVARLMSAETWLIERTEPGRGRGKTVDVRECLAAASVQSGTLCWTVRLAERGSVRPAEFLAAVGLSPQDWLHQVRRTAVRWATGPATPGPGEAACFTRP